MSATFWSVALSAARKPMSMARAAKIMARTMPTADEHEHGAPLLTGPADGGTGRTAWGRSRVLDHRGRAECSGVIRPRPGAGGTTGWFL